MSDKIINNSDNFRIKSLFYGEKVQFCVLVISFYTFLFNLGEHVNWWEKISFSLLYLTLVTSRIICPFLCCHLLYLIIYLLYMRFHRRKLRICSVFLNNWHSLGPCIILSNKRQKGWTDGGDILCGRSSIITSEIWKCLKSANENRIKFAQNSKYCNLP